MVQSLSKALLSFIEKLSYFRHHTKDLNASVVSTAVTVSRGTYETSVITEVK